MKQIDRSRPNNGTTPPVRKIPDDAGNGSQHRFPPPPLTTEQLEALRRLDSSTLANAIETFQERLRNEGFVGPPIHAIFPTLQPIVGFAVTVRIRGSMPPTASNIYSDRTDLWNYILSVPSPRVIVVEDCATQPGKGSLLGAVHANIVRALGCVGAVTNGSVRDIPTLERMGFAAFAGGVSISHCYTHIVEMGDPVEIGGLKIQSGTLLHGDIHGVQSIPLGLAARIPAVASKIIQREAEIIGLCRAPGFSVEKLKSAILTV